MVTCRPHPAAPRRRQWLLAAAGAGAAPLLLLLGGCSRGADVPAFHGVDMGGAGYARGFRLADQDGTVRTLADFAGKVVVVFFGYAQCPDVCPTTLAELAEVRRQLGAEGARVQPVFVTVDPERDTPEVLRAYMAAFGPGFVALRPAPGELAALAKDFRVYYKKVPAKVGTGYTVDHSAGSYVYDPQGKLRLYQRYGTPVAEQVADIRVLLQGR